MSRMRSKEQAQTLTWSVVQIARGKPRVGGLPDDDLRWLQVQVGQAGHAPDGHGGVLDVARGQVQAQARRDALESCRVRLAVHYPHALR